MINICNIGVAFAGAVFLSDIDLKLKEILSTQILSPIVAGRMEKSVILP